MPRRPHSRLAGSYKHAHHRRGHRGDSGGLQATQEFRAIRDPSQSSTDLNPFKFENYTAGVDDIQIYTDCGDDAPDDSFVTKSFDDKDQTLYVFYSKYKSLEAFFNKNRGFWSKKGPFLQCHDRIGTVVHTHSCTRP